MSALRVPGPDGRIRLIDQGPAAGRLHGTRATMTGPAVIHGTLIYGESQGDHDLRKQREAMARKRAKR